MIHFQSIKVCICNGKECFVDNNKTIIHQISNTVKVLNSFSFLFLHLPPVMNDGEVMT